MDFRIQGNYGGRAGWETLTHEKTPADALQMLHTYDVNEPNVRHRIKPRGSESEEALAEYLGQQQ